MHSHLERTRIVRTQKPATYFSWLGLLFFVTCLFISCSDNKNLNSPEPETTKSTPSSASPNTPVSAICANPYYPVSPTFKRDYRSTYSDVRLNTTYTESFTNI